MELLLLSAWLVPLLLAGLARLPRLWWLPAAGALPALLAAALLPAGSALSLPWLLLGTNLGLDDTARLFLAFTAVLWLAAGVYAAPAMRDTPHAARFRTFFLLAMAGNLWLIVAQDLPGFYAGFALMGIASYGLVIHDGRPQSLRAGRIYLAMTLAGELALFVALVQIADHAGTLSPTREQLAGLDDATIGLLIFGLAVKAGLVPLHLWLPLAHPAAPVPASAVLSGAMIKVALLGWLRFLPLGLETHTGWGVLLVFAGLITQFFAIPIGLVQSNPKVILAYSSVAKMGLLSLTLGLILLDPDLAAVGILAISLYAAHHALVKGGLFLGVGLRLHAPLQILILTGMVILALSLAGAPPSSGAVAKYGLKPVLAGIGWSWLELALALSALASTLLMGRFLWVLWRLEPHPERHHGAGIAAFLVLVLLALGFTGILGTPGAWLSNGLPVVLGAALAALVALAARLRPRLLGGLIDRVPPGDLIALAKPLAEVMAGTLGALSQASRRLGNNGVRAWHQLLRRLTGGERLEARLTGWQTAGTAWLGVTVLLLGLGMLAVPDARHPGPIAAPTPATAPEPEEPPLPPEPAPAAAEPPAREAPPAPEPMPEPMSKPVPELIAEQTPEQTPEPAPNEDPRLAATATPQAPAESAQAPTPPPAAEAAPAGIAEGDAVPERAPSGEPPPAPSEPTADPVSEAIPEPVLETLPDLMPDPTPDLIPDQARDPEPTPAPEVTPRAEPEPQPEAVIARDATPDTAPSPEAEPAAEPRTAPAPEPAQRAPAEGPEADAAAVCDPDTPFVFGHPEVGPSLKLTDCVQRPTGPQLMAAPPLSNALVLLVQHHLRDQGFDPGPIDGLIGPRTRAAVRAFAAARGTGSADQIDFALLRALTQTPPGAAGPAGPTPETKR